MKKTINTMEELLKGLDLKDENQIDWFNVSRNRKLSENFIEGHKYDVYWHWISKYQNLSEPFIEKHADKVDWHCISTYQKLSEGFIEQHKNDIDWEMISEHQKLSESFIEQHKDEVNWYSISIHQKLSEDFIEQHKNDVNWCCISIYQKLSKQFIEKYKNKFNMDLVNDSWNYKSTEFKKQAVIDTGLYDCYDDYFIAYKGIRGDRYSNFNFQYQYLTNQTYETFADYSNDEDSFGFSAWNYENAKNYCNELVVKVKIYYKDVARVVHNGNKIRACKITILD